MIKKSKYNNIKTEVDGITFDSKKEAERYKFLKLLLKADEIKDLKLQVSFPFTMEGRVMFSYIADFMYYDKALSKMIIEDVKGMRTPVYNLKKKLIEKFYTIKITEI